MLTVVMTAFAAGVFVRVLKLPFKLFPGVYWVWIENLALGFGVAFSQNLAYCFAARARHVDRRAAGDHAARGDRDALPDCSRCRRCPRSSCSRIYYGAQYGGSTTAVLVNLPGETAAAVTCIDGYQMARRARRPALAVAALASFFAGCIGTLLIALVGPPLGEWALKFGPWEYCALMLMGLVASACSRMATR